MLIINWIWYYSYFKYDQFDYNHSSKSDTLWSSIVLLISKGIYACIDKPVQWEQSTSLSTRSIMKKSGLNWICTMFVVKQKKNLGRSGQTTSNPTSNVICHTGLNGRKTRCTEQEQTMERNPWFRRDNVRFFYNQFIFIRATVKSNFYCNLQLLSASKLIYVSIFYSVSIFNTDR